MGTFKNGKRNGVGTLFFKNGHQYIGEFYEDNYNGLGTYIKSESDYYLGMYKNGKYHGKGVLYHNKDYYEAGIWVDGALVNKSNSNNKKITTSLIKIDDTEKKKINKCGENSDCLVRYFFNLYYKNKTKVGINKKIKRSFLYLHKMNSKLAFNTIMAIDSEVLNVINIKSLPKEVQADLSKRAQSVTDGYKQHMKKQGY